MSSLHSNEFLDPVFEKEDLIEALRSYGLLHCHKQLFLWVLRSVLGPSIVHKIFQKKKFQK